MLEVALVKRKADGFLSLPGDFTAPGDELPAFIQEEIIRAIAKLPAVVLFGMLSITWIMLIAVG